MKEYRKEELKYYIIANLILIYYLSGLFEATGQIANVENLFILAKDASLMAIIYVYVLVFDSLINQHVKDLIVYWHKEKPGTYIFDSIYNNEIKDDRIDITEAKKKYANIYKSLLDIKNKSERDRFSNSKWYKIYLKYEKDERIYNMQKDFLLFRDMSSHTLIVLIIYLLSSLLIGYNNIFLIVLILLLEYLINKFAAINRAKRFVETTIVLDLNSKK